MASRSSLIAGAGLSTSVDEVLARFDFAPAGVHLVDALDLPSHLGGRILKLMPSKVDDWNPPSATRSRTRQTRQRQ